ncbi:hypothetical protein [Butyrivibrio sp. VCD2006]|uniref:hypothetical protein n=1 Tax=Butyrivibrio sp. VCD2006 TaxID=1280664 RepID=UPI00041D6002|nr:hypothetical protein [Butyrivibrio sp. VCD2006]
MKLKYYLRGLGLGTVLTAVIMGIVLGNPGSKMSDEEIIKRAKQLGMVEAESTLSSYSETIKNPEVTDEANNTTSNTEMDKEGKEIFEEINETEPSPSEPIPEMDEASKKSEQSGENSESIESEEDVKLASDDAAEMASTKTIEAEKTETVIDDQATADSTVEETVSDNAAANNSTAKQPEAEAETEQPKAEEVVNNQSEVEEPAAEQPAASQPEASQPQTEDTNYIVVVLPSGSDSDDCARILRESGVITDGVSFNKYLISTGKDRSVRSGTKQIPRGASFEEIASIITR